jgi:hypothetical protein
MANNKQGLKEVSKNKSRHLLKNRLHDSYKSTVNISFNAFFFVCSMDRRLNKNKNGKFGYVTVSNEMLNLNYMFFAPVAEAKALNDSKLKGKFSAGYNKLPEKASKIYYSVYNKTSSFYI